MTENGRFSAILCRLYRLSLLLTATPRRHSITVSPKITSLNHEKNKNKKGEKKEKKMIKWNQTVMIVYTVVYKVERME